MLLCPMTPETRHFIDGAALKAMKKDAVLINVARGGVVDTVPALSHCMLLALSHCMLLALSHCMLLALSHCMLLALSHCMPLSRISA